MSNTNGSSGHQAMTVEGIVEAVNDKGVRVHGEWFNVSQFRPVPLPEQGAMVRLEIRPNGFIKSLEVIKAMSDTPAETTAAFHSARDDRITRLAVLKAAANFVGLWGQNREEVKSEHVLVIADKWLKWVEGE